MSKKYKVNNGSLETDKKMDYSVVKDNLLFEIYAKREWLSTEEAADFLSISENALRIMVHRTQIQAYKLGRRLRFKLSDCEALFERKGA
jgi:excisionase family DNA binding protein